MDDNKDTEQKISLGESVHINTEGQPCIYHQGVAGTIMSSKDALIKMTSGVYGLFIMLQHQAFFFPISAHMTKSHQSMLFQQIDATRKACLDALKAAQGNLSQCVAEVILVSPPAKEEDAIHPMPGDKITSSFQRAILSQDSSERIALKVKQSLTTVGLETQWREQFKSAVPPMAGTTPILHIQEEDDDEGELFFGANAQKVQMHDLQFMRMTLHGLKNHFFFLTINVEREYLRVKGVESLCMKHNFVVQRDGNGFFF